MPVSASGINCVTAFHSAQLWNHACKLFDRLPDNFILRSKLKRLPEKLENSLPLLLTNVCFACAEVLQMISWNRCVGVDGSNVVTDGNHKDFSLAVASLLSLQMVHKKEQLGPFRSTTFCKWDICVGIWVHFLEEDLILRCNVQELGLCLPIALRRAAGPSNCLIHPTAISGIRQLNKTCCRVTKWYTLPKACPSPGFLGYSVVRSGMVDWWVVVVLFGGTHCKRTYAMASPTA